MAYHHFQWVKESVHFLLGQKILILMKESFYYVKSKISIKVKDTASSLTLSQQMSR